jgi:hypothetical protein
LPRDHRRPIRIDRRTLPITTDELDSTTGQEGRDPTESLVHRYSPIRKLASELRIVGRGDAGKPNQR